MRGSDVADEFGGADEVADAPTGAVEVLAGGADGEGAFGDRGGESGDAGEGCEGEAVVDFIGEDKDVAFHAEVADGLELGFGEDFADGVVSRRIFLLVEFGAERGRERRETDGVLMTIIFVFWVMAFSSRDMSIVQSAADDTSVPPFLGGWRGTYRIVPPGISMFEMYLDYI